MSQKTARKVLLWLLVGGTPPLAVISFVVLFAFLLAVLVTSSIAALFGANTSAQAVTTSSNGQQQIIVNHSWTGQENKPVVDSALYLVNLLYNCGPDMYTQCYSNMPQDELDYWNAGCPPGSVCYNFWQSGDFQCVTFVTGAYHMAHQDLPAAPNAKDFWGLYWNGWEHISNDSIPWPGDIIVMTGPTIEAAGHVAIVVDVKLPQGNTQGYVQFAQGNAPNRIDTMALVNQNGGYVMNIWANYTVLGYLRHSAAIANS